MPNGAAVFVAGYLPLLRAPGQFADNAGWFAGWLYVRNHW